MKYLLAPIVGFFAVAATFWLGLHYGFMLHAWLFFGIFTLTTMVTAVKMK